MWSKISNVLKHPRQETTDSDSFNAQLTRYYTPEPSPAPLSARSLPDPPPPEVDINDQSSSELLIYKPDLDPSPFSAPPTSYFTSTPQTTPLPTTPPPSRQGRSLSNALFQSISRSSKPPEADINDEASSELIVYAKPDPDPFSAHATTYYTPQTMIPATPPQGAARHTRKTSKEEDLIYTLRTQLALQTELCQQYEVDLRARDELVEALGTRLDAAEKEGERRKAILKGWKKKVGELERACRHLEEEVDNSRQESMERSIMDEASSEALRMLHRQIAGLERDKSEAEKREAALSDQVATLDTLVKERGDDVQRINQVLLTKDESERVLKEGIKSAQEQMQQMGNVSIGGDDELRALVVTTELAHEEQKEIYQAAVIQWEEQRAEFSAKLYALVEQKEALTEELTRVKATTVDEFGVLKGELDAQWKRTENASETIDALQKENKLLEEAKAALRADVDALEVKIGALEVEWTETDNRRANLEAEIQELCSDRETERIELEEQLKSDREHAEDLTQALQEREDRVEQLEQEHQYAVSSLEENIRQRDEELAKYSQRIADLRADAERVLEEERQYAQDNVSRLEENIRQRDAEVAEYSQRVVEREADAEQLREEISRMKRDHARVVDEQSRALQDTAGQEGESRQRMELLVMEKAAADVEMSTLKDRVAALKDEVERLRRQVHGLQQESADKEVKIVQIAKQRAQDKEDMHGLNIALDSKQQELELLKRRLGVRGTAGSTPAQPSKVAHHQRRDSFAFSTPGMSRPPSAMSDSGKESVSAKDRRPADTPSTVGKTLTLGKSLRTNMGPGGIKLGRAADGTMGPPPAKGRVSIGTPTPMGRVPSIEARMSARPAQPGAVHRRVSSSTLKTSRSGVAPSPAPSADEKENLDVSRRRSVVPA